jgi:HEAT repeat protein
LFSLAKTQSNELLAFEFGDAVELQPPLEELLLWILEDLEERKYGFLDLSTSQCCVFLHRWLKESLAAQDHARTLTVLRALGFLRATASARHVQPVLDLPTVDSRVRAEAILTLGRIGLFESIPKIEPFLNAPSREERSAAITAISKSGNRGAYAKLQVAAGNDEDLLGLVRSAHRRLDALEKKDMREFCEVVIASAEWLDLLHIMSVARNDVVAIANDPRQSAEFRRRAIELAGAMKEPTIVPVCLAVLEEGDTSHQPLIFAAIFAAGRTRSEQAIEPIGRLLDSSDRIQIERAITALGRIGTPDAVSPLLRLWSVEGGAYRKQIKAALVRMSNRSGPDSVEAHLRAGMKWQPAQIYFVDDAWQLSRRYSEGLLDPALRSQNPESRREAILLIASLGAKTEAMKLENLRKEEPNPALRELAGLAAARMGTP